MSSKIRKTINFPFCLCVVYFCMASYSMAEDPPPEDIVVTGQRLESAMNAGDYYMIGYYQGLLAKQEWEDSQNQKSNTGSPIQETESSEEEDSGEDVERCVQVEKAEMALCQKQSQERFTQKQKNCSRVVSMIDYLPIVGGQSYTRCVDDATAVLEEDLAECQFVSEYGKAQCYN